MMSMMMMMMSMKSDSQSCRGLRPAAKKKENRCTGSFRKRSKFDLRPKGKNCERKPVCLTKNEKPSWSKMRVSCDNGYVLQNTK